MVKRVIKDLFFILIGSLISAVGLHYFVYPASFAPSGFDGVATMLQYLTDNTVSAGVFTLALNVPLLVLACFLLDKKFALYTIISIVSLSGFIVLLGMVNFLQAPITTNLLISAVFSGLMIGVRTGLVLKVGGSSGGVDVIAAVIQKKNPYINIETYITILCYIIIGVSFFVYDRELEPILLSIIQMFVFEKTVSFTMRSKRNAVEFKIITNDPEVLKEDIIKNLKHGATVLDGKGMFTGNDKSVVLCVVNLRQAPEFMKILKKYDNLFVYCTNISSVNGNFRWNREDIAK